MHKFLNIRAASVAFAYANGSGRVDTVLIKGKDGPVRVNKSDFDADQADKKNMTKYTGKDADAKAAPKGKVSDVNVTGEGEGGEVKTTAAPSAPDFTPAGETATPPMDETKAAAAPASTTADQLLVMKKGSGKSAKFHIVDGMGQPLSSDRMKLLGIAEDGYDTEAAASKVVSTTEPKPA